MPTSSEHMVCLKTSKLTVKVYFEIFNLNYGSRGDLYSYLFTTNQIEIEKSISPDSGQNKNNNLTVSMISDLNDKKINVILLL